MHKEDGPAVELDGIKQYLQNGKLHRLNGPAIEYSNGDISYYIDGNPYCKENYYKLINNVKLNSK